RPGADVQSLSGRPESQEPLRAPAQFPQDPHYAVGGPALPTPAPPAAPAAWAGLGDGAVAPVPDATRRPALAALAPPLDDGLPAPAVVVLPWPTAETPGLPAPEAVHAA
ncbi:hypothetical protein VM98_37185, partial [Streptomyces rubellomurinus subsp. indigoferus]